MVVHLVWKIDGGGAEVIVSSLCKIEGITSIVVALNGKRFKSYFDESKNVRIFYLPWHKLFTKIATLFVLNIMSVLMCKRIVWHFHFPAMHKFFLKLPRKHLVTCHDAYQDVVNIEALGQFKSIVAISDHIKKYLYLLGHEENVILIDNGIERFDYDFPIRDDNEFIQFVTVARIDIYKKGYDIIVDALRTHPMPNWSWEIVGDGHDMEALKHLISKSGLEGQVTFHGAVDKFNVYKILSNADVFVLASRFEGFGLSVFEALRMGLDVIVPEGSGPSEIVRKTGFGRTFIPESSKSLRNELLLSRKKRIEKRMKQQRELNDTFYSADKMREKYYRLYRI